MQLGGVGVGGVGGSVSNDVCAVFISISGGVSFTESFSSDVRTRRNGRKLSHGRHGMPNA